jgi:hypothetical protein
MELCQRGALTIKELSDGRKQIKTIITIFVKGMRIFLSILALELHLICYDPNISY